MKLSTKLYGSVCGLALIGMVLAGASVWYIRTLAQELRTATEKTAVKLVLVNDAQAASWEMIAALRGAFVYTSLGDSAKLEANIERAKAAFQQMGEGVREVRPLLMTEQNKKDLAKFEAALADVEKFSATYIRLCREHKLGEISAIAPQAQAFIEATDQALGNIETSQRNFLKESQADAVSLGSQSLWATILLSCVLILVAVFAVFVVRGINRTLVTAVGELFEGAEQVAGAAGQVSASSQSLAQGSSEQAASLEETSAAGEEIRSMARKNTENSHSAADLVTQSQQKISETNQSLEQMVVAMGEINASSDKISKIIKVIDEIAFQTNILALNAAVEAARAGEAGMGFAVVADEVRNLSQRCAQAAKDTAVLIEESISKSNDGKAKVDQVAVAIRSITAQSGTVKTLVEEVNLGSQEQAKGIEQIGKAITQMEQVTQGAAASAEEGASAAEELNAQSQTLKAIVERLADMVGGRENGGSSGGSERLHSVSVKRPAVVHKPAMHAGNHGVAPAKSWDELPLEEDFREVK